MDGDFGTQLDAALNAGLRDLHAAAEEARARIDQGVEAIRVVEPSPVFAGTTARAAAVSFDLAEEQFDAAADAEGIPLPEDN